MSKIIERYIITSAWQHYHSPDSLLFNTFINESLFLSLQPEHQRDGSNFKAITRPSGHTFTLDYWPSHPSLKSLVTNCINSPSFRHLICILKMHAPQPQKSCHISSTEKAIYTKQKCNQVYKFRQYRNLSLLKGL